MADKTDAKFRGMWNPQIRDPVFNPNRFVLPQPTPTPQAQPRERSPSPPPSPPPIPTPPPEIELPPEESEEKEVPQPSPPNTIEEEMPISYEPSFEESLPSPHRQDEVLLPHGKLEARKGNVKINPDATPLLRATYDVNIDEFLEHLKADPGQVNIPENLHGYTPLLVAAETGNDEHALFMVKHLIEAGADIKYRDVSGFSPFLQACSKGNLETVKYFVSLGEDVNQENPIIHATGFYLASEKGHLQMMEYLLSLGADVNRLVVRGFQSYPALLMCAQKGNLELVTWLVDHGADVNVKCRTVEKNRGIKVLHHVSGLGQLEIARYLITKGASVNDKDNELGATPIIFAAKTGKASLVELLASYGANVNERRGDGAFPLFLAAQNGHVKTVKVLLKSGAQPNMLYGKKTPLAIAKQMKHEAVVKVLKQSKEDCLVM